MEEDRTRYDLLTNSVREVEQFLDSTVWRDVENTGRIWIENWKEALVKGKNDQNYSDDIVRGIIIGIGEILSCPTSHIKPEVMEEKEIKDEENSEE